MPFSITACFVSVSVHEHALHSCLTLLYYTQSKKKDKIMLDGVASYHYNHGPEVLLLTGYLRFHFSRQHR